MRSCCAEAIVAKAASARNVAVMGVLVGLGGLGAKSLGGKGARHQYALRRRNGRHFGETGGGAGRGAEAARREGGATAREEGTPLACGRCGPACDRRSRAPDSRSQQCNASTPYRGRPPDRQRS